MKTCTGEQYQGQTIHLAATQDWHGKYGHFNVRRMDHDSACTGYGVHDRVMACVPQHGMLYCRVDHVWELGAPTPEQVLQAAKKQNGDDQKGRWLLHQVQPWECGKSTDYYFVRSN